MDKYFFSEEYFNKIRKIYKKDIVMGLLMGRFQPKPNIDTFPSKNIKDNANIQHDANIALNPVKEGTEVEVDSESNTNLSHKEIVYSAGEIHAAFRTCALAYMKEYKNYEISAKVKLRKERLERLGFTSSETLKISNEKFCMVCFQWFKSHFPECIFLPTDKFITLLKQYNLVCGTLEEYKGNISDDNLEEITQVADILNNVKDNNPYSNRIDNDYFHVMITGINNMISAHNMKDRQTLEALRFPFESEPINAIESFPMIYVETRPTYSTQLFIAAFAKDMKTVAEYSHPYTHREEPFIFQLTPYGVVIFSKWGEEAEDEKVNPY